MTTTTLICIFLKSIFRHGWASTIAAIRTPNMKVICPTAHAIPVSLNAGFRMPSWFDLKTLDISGPEDEDGIKAAAKMVHEMVTKEIHDGIPSTRIMLGGFSQGGALALYSALTYAEPLAGVMALSCWLPLYKTFPQSKKCPDTVPVRRTNPLMLVQTLRNQISDLSKSWRLRSCPALQIRSIIFHIFEVIYETLGICHISRSKSFIV